MRPDARPNRPQGVDRSVQSLAGVPSSLIVKHTSWVKSHASRLHRRLPPNVEKDDLVQAGLIAVAWASLAFEWTADDRNSEEAQEAFIRFAQKRVKGAMLDELRQMDPLSRGQRTKMKVVQATRDGLRAKIGLPPTLSELSAASGIEMNVLGELDGLAQLHSARDASHSDDHGHPVRYGEAATDHDEIEVRIDAAQRQRWVQTFIASLPETDQRVVDSYLGEGVVPSRLAMELNVSASAVSLRCKAVVDKVARHLAIRERNGAASGNAGAGLPQQCIELARVRVDSGTRWG